MNIHEAITAIMQEGYTISKSKRNQQQGFMYRGIDDVMNTFQPLLSKFHVYIVPEVLETTREERTTGKGGTLLYSILKIKYTFYAEDGSSISAVVIGEGMDSGDKASNKAMAVALKYAMFQVFCIPTEEMHDPDAETPPPSTPKADAKKTTPLYICTDCSNKIADAKAKDGTVWTAENVAKYAEARYGRYLCPKCQAKAEKAMVEASGENP